ncbi:MAG: hypothetical protein INR64_02695 [Caulobacteraceae bacterium]|nr:hypothetical protein [Caulobacter sp.]
MTAVVLPLLLLVGGFATDYGYASYLNQRLTQATDNAVLASVSQSAATAGGGFGNTAWLQDYGTRVFNSNIADLPISKVTFNLQVTQNQSLGVNSVGSYTYRYPTFFAGVVGISSIPLSSQIKASANPITYIDYYILVDVSQSMGIAATQTDMNNMWNWGLSHGAGAFGEPSCVFACHIKRPEQALNPQTNEQIARSANPPVTLRLDSAIQAIQNIIAQAQVQAGTNKNIRFAIYTINGDPLHPGEKYKPVAALSSDYSNLMTAAATIDLGSSTDPYADTNFTDSLSAFSSNELPATNGSGASAVSPQRYVFLITDGLTDNGNLLACIALYNSCTKPINPSDCANIKSKTQGLGIIYTVYNPIYQNNDKKQGLEPVVFKPLVAPFLTIDKNGNVTDDQMADNLQLCSSGLYFPAADGPAIDVAMRNLFASTLKNARLTH